MNETKVPENRAYKVTVILLLGLAAFSTAMKELNRLYEMVSTVHEFTRQWRGSDLVTLNEKPISTQETVSTIESCLNESSHFINSSADSGSGDRIAAATEGYIERMDYETISEPEVCAKVDLIAGKRANRHAPRLVRAKFAPAGNLKERIASLRPDGNWEARFEYKALDRRFTVELPMTMLSDIKAGAFENEVSPDFVRGLLGTIDRKRSHGKTENRRRDLMIKRFERSISSRRAS